MSPTTVRLRLLDVIMLPFFPWTRVPLVHLSLTFRICRSRLIMSFALHSGTKRFTWNFPELS